MSFAIRLFLGYFLIVGLAAWFILGYFSREVEPGVRQGTEDTLVDAAHLLAESIAPHMAQGRLDENSLLRAARAVQQRQPQANIHGNLKQSIELRLYVTDAHGIVLFDSLGRDAGRDYSRWRDVHLALRGQYGARSTRDVAEDENSSVMYVAAPVVHEGRVLGVLALGKPSRTVAQYANNARQRVRQLGLILLLASAAIGVFFTAWLTHSITALREYARKVADGQSAKLPTGGGSQLTELARALEHMRQKLDGKQYVEHYVQSLTHEMKSPLTAIRAAAELLPDAPAQERAQFGQTIVEQTERLQLVIDRLLELARVEQLHAPAQAQTVPTRQWVQQVLASRRTRLQARGMAVQVQESPAFAALADAKGGAPASAPVPASAEPAVQGDQFLLQQALGNVLDNALDFAPAGSAITLTLALAAPAAGQPPLQTITVRDRGSGLPPYAQAHVFRRFYSLPRPDTGRKSTGLGLAFVREVMRIHQGRIEIANASDGPGAVVCLSLPLATVTAAHAANGMDVAGLT
ncbi:MAG: two-component system sensor histidine kinase CreC [Comamonadaceae bacterium]|nr:two-component system sensor histidine kinase CreC [Comamonadaceae bacterium]